MWVTGAGAQKVVLESQFVFFTNLRQNLKWKANQQNREENSYKFEPSLQANANWQQRYNELWLPDMTQFKYDLNTYSFAESI
jgi:hypothetical protein